MMSLMSLSLLSKRETISLEFRHIESNNSSSTRSVKFIVFETTGTQPSLNVAKRQVLRA